MIDQRGADTGAVFRDANESDVEAVVSLVESAYRGEASRDGWTTEADLLDGQRTDAAAVTEVLSRPGARILVAVDPSDTIVACCHLERRPDGSAYFGMFAVRPGLQGRGLGRRVLEEAERLAVEGWSAPTMTMSVLSARQDLIGWYERLGYRRTGETAPFPYGDERYGRPLVDDLVFAVLARDLTGPPRP